MFQVTNRNLSSSFLFTAQNSLSPSETHDSERKPLDADSPIHEITRQPISSIREESEDKGDGDQDKVRETNNNEEERKSSLHCVGVEATAVRQLAASTGTVAILGTTAKVVLKKSASGNLIEEEVVPENADVVEVVIEHNNIIPSIPGPLHQTIEAIAKEVKLQNGVHKPLVELPVKVEEKVTNESTISTSTVTVVEKIAKETQNVEENRFVEPNTNVHINSELTNKVNEAISISEQNNNVSNVNIARSNLDNQIKDTIVTSKLESNIPESNIENSTEKAPSLEVKPSSEDVHIIDTMDQSNNSNIETRTNNTNLLDKQTKVPLAKHFKQEVNTSEVIAKQKSRSSKDSSLEKEITLSSFDKDQSIDSNKTEVTNLSKTSSLEQNSETVVANQSQTKPNPELTKLPSIDKIQLSSVSDTVEEIIANATSIVLEKSKAKLSEKSTELETLETESKKSMSNDLDSDSNGTSDQTVISQESLNEENTREGVTNVTISKTTKVKSIDQENDTKEDLEIHDALKEEMKKGILPHINGIIQEAEEHVKNYTEQISLIVENGLIDDDSASLKSKNSFDKEENEKDETANGSGDKIAPVEEERIPPVVIETLPKKMKKELSLSLASQADESSIEISPENDVSNTVSETSEATKDAFTPQSRTPVYDETPLSEEKTPCMDLKLSDSMVEELKKQIDDLCDEAASRIATATTKIQAGYRGYKTRKEIKQTKVC